MEPTLTHMDKENVPKWDYMPVPYILIGGEAMGKVLAVPVHSRHYLLGLKSGAGQNKSLGNHLYGESGLCIL